MMARYANVARLAAALAAGATLHLAFAPYGYYLLAFLCLAALFWLWDCSEPKFMAQTGFIFGLGMFGFGVWWVQVSVHQFGLPIYSFSVAVTAGFVLILCAYPAFCGYLAAKLPASHRFARVLFLYPAAWTLSEALRGWLFTGFPWLLVGYSQTDSPLSVFAPVVGVYGVSFITALVAAAMVVVVRAQGGWRQIGVCVLLGIAVAAVALADVHWTRAAGAKHAVALVQGAVPQAIKWHPEHRQPSIDLYTELSKPHWGKSLIVWPETGIPAFTDEVPEVLAELKSQATESGTSLLVGIATGNPSGGGEYFNSVVQLGAGSGHYNKRHLVPFGEYLPFDKWLRPLTSFLRIPMSNFSPGELEQPLLSVGGYSVGVSICFEDAYAEEVTRALPQANVLVNVSNDAWFGNSIAPHQHLQIARMRALETERYMLRATNTGISAIIDERGKIVAASKQFVVDVVSGEMIPRTGSTPAARFGIRATLALCFILIAICVLTAAGRKRRTP